MSALPNSPQPTRWYIVALNFRSGSFRSRQEFSSGPAASPAQAALFVLANEPGFDFDDIVEVMADDL